MPMMPVSKRYRQNALPVGALGNLTGKLLGRVVNAYRQPQRSLGSAVQHNNRANPATSAVTQYHEIEQIYNRKKKGRLSKRGKLKRKRAKQFKRKVTKVLEKPVPLCSTHQYSNALKGMDAVTTAAWNTTPQQTIASTNTTSADFAIWTGGLMGAAGITPISKDINDVVNMGANIYTPLNATTNVIAKVQQLKFRINYCDLNISIHENTNNTQNIDIYEFVAKRDMGSGDLYFTPKAAWIQCIADTNQEGKTLPTITDFGYTPLDTPGFGKHWTLKNKTRILLGAGQNTTFKIRGPTGMYDYPRHNNRTAIKGKTTHIMIISMSEVGYGIAAGAGTLIMAWNKSYHFKPIGGNFALEGNQCIAWNLQV